MSRAGDYFLEPFTAASLTSIKLPYEDKEEDKKENKA